MQEIVLKIECKILKQDANELYVMGRAEWIIHLFGDGSGVYPI
jgi:hypothetical protein